MYDHVDIRMKTFCNIGYLTWLISKDVIFSHGNFGSDRENS